MKSRQDVKGLINILKKTHPTYEQEREVVAALVEIGDTAIDFLIASLEEHIDEPIRWDAWALGEIGDTKAVQPLIQALTKGDYYLASSAAEALGKIRDTRAVLPLIEVLKRNYEPLRGTFRYNAVEALGQIGDTRAIEMLIEILNNSKDYYIGRLAAQALGKMGDNRAVEHLINALNEDNVSLQCDVAEALGEIGDVKASSFLIRTLKKRLNSFSKDSYNANSEKVTILAIKKALEKLSSTSEENINVNQAIIEANKPID